MSTLAERRAAMQEAIRKLSAQAAEDAKAFDQELPPELRKERPGERLVEAVLGRQKEETRRG